MPRTPEDKQRLYKQKRANILAAAEKVFAHKGLAATMDDIAAEASISHGLAYRYFKNKEAIFYALVERAIQSNPLAFQQALEMPGTPGERLAAVISGFVESRRQPEPYLLLSQVLNSEAAPDGLRTLVRQRGQDLKDVLRQLIVEGQAAGEVARDDPDQLVRAIFACLDGLIQWALNHPEQYKEDFPDAKIFLRMLKPD